MVRFAIVIARPKLWRSPASSPNVARSCAARRSARSRASCSAIAASLADSALAASRRAASSSSALARACRQQHGHVPQRPLRRLGRSLPVGRGAEHRKRATHLLLSAPSLEKRGRLVALALRLALHLVVDEIMPAHVRGRERAPSAPLCCVHHGSKCARVASSVARRHARVGPGACVFVDGGIVLA